MAMLAEKRERKPYVLLPRGKALYEDDNRFGTRMLEKMGWSKGKGLGANEDGQKEFVRIKYRNNNLGLGFEDRNDQWVQHEADFDGLLRSLTNNKDESMNNTTTEIPETLAAKFSSESLEEKSKKSKARVHYKKFTRSKDLSRYSEKDLANIFGKKSMNEMLKESMVDTEKATSNKSELVSKIDHNSNGKNSDGAFDFGITTINTGTSINDYFKQKMRNSKNQEHKDEQCDGSMEYTNDSPVLDQIVEEPLDNLPKCTKRKKKKRKLSENSSTESKDQHNTIVEEQKLIISNGVELDQNKKKNKKKKRNETDSAIIDSVEVTVTQQSEPMEESNVNSFENNFNLLKKKKKKKDENINEVKCPNDGLLVTKEIPSEICQTNEAVENVDFIQAEMPLPEPDSILSSELQTNKKVKRKKDKGLLVTPDTTKPDTDDATLILPKKSKKKKLKEEVIAEETTKVENIDCDDLKGGQEDIVEGLQIISENGAHSAECMSNSICNQKPSEDFDVKNENNEKMIYNINTFVALKFRETNFESFTGSNLSKIIGYGLTKNLQICVEEKATDMENITKFCYNAMFQNKHETKTDKKTENKETLQKPVADKDVKISENDGISKKDKISKSKKIGKSSKSSKKHVKKYIRKKKGYPEYINKLKKKNIFQPI